VAEILSTLPPLPERMRRLPIDERGYPVPHFVTWLDEAGKPLPNGQGKPDFRVITSGRVLDVIRFRLCWICGGKLGSFASFVSGPMCGINRTNGEPPNHLECALFAAKACPFLTRPAMKRRENNLPEDHRDAAGVMIRRNPGVCIVWTTRQWKPWPVENGVLFKMGDPTSVTFWREGRSATRAEVWESIEEGLPLLRTEAEKEGEKSMAMLDAYVRRFEPLCPRPEAS
jgi:hypothetical protein